jgi:hypothetical protein
MMKSVMKKCKAIPTGILPIGIALLLTPALKSCATDDLGLCTILMSGDDVVYEEITIEECQDIFGSTPGARGWQWDPQD